MKTSSSSEPVGPEARSVLKPDTPAPPVDVPGTGALHARLHTRLGEITFELYELATPRTVANFVGLAQGGFPWKREGQPTTEPLYPGTRVLRAIPNFMIHMGCPRGDGLDGPGYRFGDEIHPTLRHDTAGVVSMANAGANTNGSQFFITDAATPWLDGRHAVFGRVVAGIEVVRALARVPTDAEDRPLEPVTLERVDVFRGEGSCA